MDRYLILWPERRHVSAQQLITWARDDIDNGLSDLFAFGWEVNDVADAILVLKDTGSVTLGE